MDEKAIELELRAEILPQDQELLKKRLGEIGALHSHTKRLSIMYFGNIGTKKLDEGKMENSETATASSFL